MLPSASQARWCRTPLSYPRVIAQWKHGDLMSCVSSTREEYCRFSCVRVVRIICSYHICCCTHSSVVSWKNTLFLGVDACFKLKLKDRGFDDPDLGTGLAYMVNEDSYQAYLAANADSSEPVSYAVRSCGRSLISMTQITTCGPDLNAVSQAYTKYSQGYAITGVAAVSCRHTFVRPKGVVDLQKGER